MRLCRHAPCCPANSRKRIKVEKKQENLRSGSTEAYSVEALCGQGALVYNGDVKVLLTQRSSNQVLLTKRSGHQVLLTKRWKGYAPLVYTTKWGAYPLSVYKMGVGQTARFLQQFFRQPGNSGGRGLENHMQTKSWFDVAQFKHLIPPFMKKCLCSVAIPP